ncbi:MAG TPA: MBL fold metallo-hydrolase [Smithellaceae bacterium]|nr:MBL fold metallo-hydrolase [Smithellaceae bacterium]
MKKKTERVRFGTVSVIPGEDGGRFPRCTSLLIDDDVKVLVDPGAGLKTMAALNQETTVDVVINTHYHFDHIAYNYLFDRARILLNEQEAPCFQEKKNLASLLGMEEVYGPEWVDQWIERIAGGEARQSPYSPQNRHEWWLSASRVDGVYRWGDVLDFGKTRVQILGAPGHSKGFSCLHFPGLGVMYVADIDLTAFGPWYAGSDGDIDLFLSSCEALKAVDCEFFITGHEAGILRRKDFLAGLERFTAVIDERDEKILSVLKKPLSFREIVDQGLIYGRRYHVDAWVYMWEFLMIKKHLHRMIRRGRILDRGDSFIAV